MTVPLCRVAHQIYHKHGRRDLEERYGVDLEQLLVEHNTRYRKEVKPKLTKPRTLKKVKLFAKCPCGGMHPVRAMRYFCTRTRKYEEVA